MRVSPRGRAILHLLAPEAVNERSFRPGDFVLTHSRGSLARSMGLATASDLNQAALIVDSSGGLIEVNPFFVTAAGGLRRSHIAEYLERGVSVWVGYVELLDGTRSEVVRFAEQMLEEHQRFTEWQFAGLLLHLALGIAPRHLTGKYRPLRPLHGLFDQHALVLKEENIFTSAELVARALERGGFLWEKDPAYITPADLLEHFCPPGRRQEVREAIRAKARAARTRAPVRSVRAPQMLPTARTGEGAELLRQEFEAESIETSAPELSPFPRPRHLQEQVALRVGALLLGGFMVALGLGWAARMLEIGKEQ